jgi:hypothetical protein
MGAIKALAPTAVIVENRKTGNYKSIFRFGQTNYLRAANKKNN